MMASIKNNRIEIDGHTTGFLRIPGAKCAANRWTMPLTLDTCAELKKLGVAFSDELREFANKQFLIQRYINQMKNSTRDVEPLQPIPIKAPYSLYQHQVKAYNITLALFGRGARKGGSA